MKQTRAITVAQYLHSFGGYPGLRDELINGKVFMADLSKPLHQHIKQNIFLLLHSACERTDYTVNGSTNILFHASNSAPSPDLFVIETSRWNEAMREGTYIDASPILAVEVLSPDENVREKTRIYLKDGVASLWIVDPKRRIVRVYGGSEKRQYCKHTEINLPVPLNGSVRVDDIFSRLPDSFPYEDSLSDAPPYFWCSDNPAFRDKLNSGSIVKTHLPKPLHQHVEQNLLRILHSACKHTDYTANGNTHIHFQASDSAPYPDVFVIETSRWMEAIAKDWYTDGPPLLAVEVLSPSEDVSEKISIYLEEGVASTWVVDIQRRTVLVYSGAEERQYGEHAEIALPFPLNGSAKVDDIFFGVPESFNYNRHGEFENIADKDASVTQEHAITVAQYLHSFKGYPGRAILDELINGRVVMSTEPHTAHALVRMNIYPLLDSACDGTDYEGFFRSNIQFPASNSAPAPDVCVVEKEPKLRYGHFEGSLLLAVEVLKPSEDVSEKVSLYLKESVASIWVVDIPRRIVLVYSGSEMRQYAEHTEIELSFPLKGSVRVDDVFSGLPESISHND